MKNIDKSRAKEYFDRLIVFIYLKNAIPFINELGKYTKKIEK